MNIIVLALKSADAFLLAFFAIIMIAAVIFVIYYKRKNTLSSRPSSRSSKAVKDTNVKVLDAKALLDKVDTIVDGIIITDGYSRFLSALDCRGVDFWDQGYDEQVRTVNGYQAFISSLKEPITYRAYSKSIDISKIMDKYQAALDKATEQCDYLKERLAGIEKDGDIIDIEATKKAIDTLTFRIQHLDIQMSAMEYYSSADVVQEVAQSYIFEWRYSPSQYSVTHTKEERLALAKQELASIAESKMKDLSMSGVRARVCTQNEILEMFRRLTQPIASEQESIVQIQSSSYFDDIVMSGTKDIMSGNGEANVEVI